jgi:hypothetical protein
LPDPVAAVSYLQVRYPQTMLIDVQFNPAATQQRCISLGDEASVDGGLVSQPISNDTTTEIPA